MRDEFAPLAHRIDGDRMRELLVDFANLQEAAEHAAVTAEWFAGLLRASGAVEARIYGRDLGTPVVVAGFPGTHRGPTLQFMGYFAAPSTTPRKTFAAGGCVHGPAVVTGAAGLIAAAEAARILAAHGLMPGGGLLFTARALGERSDAASDIGRLIDRGIAGQAVVIAGGSSNMLPVTGQGMCMFEVEFTIPEPGPSTMAGRSTAIDAAHAFCGAVRRHQAAMARTGNGTYGPETVVVGSVRGGDRFDTMARSSWLKGAWRYWSGRTAAEVRGELDRIAQRVAAACGARATLTVEVLRAPYRLDVTQSPVHELLAAYRAVWGRDLPLGACTLPNDVPLFLERGIPAVCHGPRPTPVECVGDEECVSVEDMVRLAEVYAQLSLNYLHREDRSVQGKYAPGDRDELGENVAGDFVAHTAIRGFAV
jgi:acetylornithine deacetylase/succinyl-diaminopimelate desuccinylase-like protein